MAFNFNWAPLSGDPGFYKRAEELLTDAMNKNPKPPIIVDDIIVTELNLGDVPPDLEVVEISDIGVDRFRGTFKMSYSGNAYITIKTRVQANPLNTYLLTRPSFGSPQPLAAATGLTIPLQITLSDFQLSAIIILVFSRQKGLTIVFRNDPLESLKVSSTFDSIPFVANYLQQVIEGQLRTLLMDELPAIIHRLSIRLWVPEHKAREERALSAADIDQDEPVIDPLASPPQDPVDSSGTALSPAEVAALSLDSHVETQSLFSQKNLLRLATLTDSHRTLSLFTPSIRDAVFRAWTGPLERGEMSGLHSRTPSSPALSRTHSHAGSMSTTYTFDSTTSIRPTLSSFPTGSYGMGTGGGRHPKSHPMRKRKKRVVNLRKQPETGEFETITEDGSTVTDSASVAESTTSDGPSIFSAPPATPLEVPFVADDPVTPPLSPQFRRRNGKDIERTPHARPSLSTSATNTQGLGSFAVDDSLAEDVSSRRLERDRTLRTRQRRVVDMTAEPDQTPRASMYLPDRNDGRRPELSRSQTLPQNKETAHMAEASPSSPPLPNFLSFIADSSNGTSIVERAWMMKMAAEMARRYTEEREKGHFDVQPTRDDDHRVPPPAYAQ